MTTEETELTTFGPCAVALGVQPHHIERLAERDQIPYRRAGRVRVVNVSDYPVIRAALVRAGYLKPAEPAAEPGGGA